MKNTSKSEINSIDHLIRYGDEVHLTELDPSIPIVKADDRLSRLIDEILDD